MGLVIDTSAIVELERGRARWDGVLEKAGREPVFLPAIVWGELLAGVYLADSVSRALKRREKLDQLRQVVPVLPFTEETAEAWAELFAELQRAGTPIPANDLCVAATAKVEGHRILVSSRDEGHYRLVPGVEVMTL
jgi:tRNA(fMet)-specific endonuclease VapC